MKKIFLLLFLPSMLFCQWLRFPAVQQNIAGKGVYLNNRNDTMWIQNYNWMGIPLDSTHLSMSQIEGWVWNHRGNYTPYLDSLRIDMLDKSQTISGKKTFSDTTWTHVLMPHFSAGRLGWTRGDTMCHNYFLGLWSGNSSMTGSENTGLGYETLLDNTTGSYNTACGAGALWKNQTGYGNTAIGVGSLQSNMSSPDNTAVGTNTLGDNTNGTLNVAMGTNTLQHNTTGTENTAIGASASYSNKTGILNTAIGSGSLYYNLHSVNTAVGAASLFYDTSGDYNTVVGTSAMEKNLRGSQNVTLGEKTLYTDTAGNNNTAIGIEALYHSVGSNNVALGAFSGYWELGSNTFYAGNVLQANNADERAYSLLYGTFSGTAGSLAGQQLTINGALNVNRNISASNLKSMAGTDSLWYFAKRDSNTTKNPITLTYAGNNLQPLENQRLSTSNSPIFASVNGYVLGQVSTILDSNRIVMLDKSQIFKMEVMSIRDTNNTGFVLDPNATLSGYNGNFFATESSGRGHKPIVFRTSNVNRLVIKTNGVIVVGDTIETVSGSLFSVKGSISTTAPAGHTATAFKVGEVADGYLYVDIGGSVYKIAVATP